MNKENQFQQFKEITHTSIEIIKDQPFIIYGDFDINIYTSIVGLTTIIIATFHFTDLSKKEINKYLKREINMSFEDLLYCEDWFYKNINIRWD